MVSILHCLLETFYLFISLVKLTQKKKKKKAQPTTKKSLNELSRNIFLLFKKLKHLFLMSASVLKRLYLFKYWV